MTDGVIFGGSKPNDKVCQALAKVLADAKRGDVQLVGIIRIGEDGRPGVLFGGEEDLTPSLNLGLDMLKATIMQQIVSPPVVRRALETVPGSREQ
jgi:hypothetical protein